MRRFNVLRALFAALAFTVFSINSASAQTGSCDQEHADNCVLWVRNCASVPSLPFGLTTLESKRKIINSYTPAVGSVAVMDTSIYEGHVAYVAAVNADGTISIRDANNPSPGVRSRTATPAALNVLGYFNPGAGRPDLIAVKKSVTPSGRAEAHIMSEGSVFQQYITNAVTAQPIEDQYAYEFETADWDRDGRPDLFAIKKSGTSSGKAEVHITSGAGGFQYYIFNVVTPQSVESRNYYDFEVADWERDGRPDLLVIKKGGTPSGKAEVHILSGASNFQQYILNTATVQSVEDVYNYEFEVADWNRDGKPDLFAIKKTGTPSGKAEVHILSGAANFQQYLLNVGTIQAVEAVANYEFEVADWDRDGRPDLVAVKKAGTPNGKAEVHVASGVNAFQQYILNRGTLQTVESADAYDFEMADW